MIINTIIDKTTFLLLLTVSLGFSQDKKPTLMILPSDNWCEQRYFMTEFDNQGTKQKVPNYKQAFQEDTEIGQVISKIGSLMIDRHEVKSLIERAKSVDTKFNSFFIEEEVNESVRRILGNLVVHSRC